METATVLQLAGIAGRVIIGNLPTILKLVHDVVHQLQDHPNPAVASAANDVHDAMHGDTRAQPGQ